MKVFYSVLFVQAIVLRRALPIGYYEFYWKPCLLLHCSELKIFPKKWLHWHLQNAPTKTVTQKCSHVNFNVEILC